jgi:hypothetical protein
MKQHFGNGNKVKMNIMYFSYLSNLYIYISTIYFIYVSNHFLIYVSIGWTTGRVIKKTYREPSSSPMMTSYQIKLHDVI